MNKPPSVIAAWQALYRHFKSSLSSSFSMLSGAIIFIIIIIIQFIENTEHANNNNELSIREFATQ